MSMATTEETVCVATPAAAEPTAAVVVLYHCDPEGLVDQLASEEGVTVVLVDNTPGRDLSSRYAGRTDVAYVAMGGNTGIGAAHNAGVAEARRRGCTMVVFFDQDSLPEKGYVGSMAREYRLVERREPRLFLLGPTVSDGRTGDVARSAYHPEHEDSDGFVERREVVCSGTCVSLSKIDAVGEEDERLFIDYVDFEWCWRGRQAGYVSGITRKHTLTHFVGKGSYRFLGLTVIVSAPVRYYYQTRNYLLLLRRPYVPLQWKLARGVKHLIYPLTYPFKVKEWRKIWRESFRGLRDGMRMS